MSIPPQKQELNKQAETEVKEIENQYTSGLVTAGERYNKVVDIRSRRGEQVGKVMMEQLGTEEVENRRHGKKVKQEAFNSIYMMADSARAARRPRFGSWPACARLMAKPDSSIIETPITANFREGLNVLQYFISTHGARKGLADTALKTANSGYLTRRLVDVTQDLVVTEGRPRDDQRRVDEGAGRGRRGGGGAEGAHPRPRARDRPAARRPRTCCSRRARCSTTRRWTTIDNVGIDEVKVRTGASCDTRWGVCSKWPRAPTSAAVRRSTWARQSG